MTTHQRIFAITATLVLLVVILELIRKKKLKEEYSWLWLLTGIIVPVVVIWDDLLKFLSSSIGAVDPFTTVILCGFFFLIIIIIHYSIKISLFNDQIKNLAQQIGLLYKELDKLKNDKEEN